MENFETNEKTETLCIGLEHVLPKGTRGRLTIEYVGTMNDKMAGFYRSSYKHEQTGEPRWMLATQFEATDARRALPCWDEPAVKATFSVSIRLPADQPNIKALGNMDEKAVVSDGATRLVSFKRTPLMSTYLLAWVVGELDDGNGAVERTRHGGVEVRVWAPAGTPANRGDFARGVAARTLDFFAEYFGLAYPLPKLDMVAVPDFAAGAMENWGLVTYRLVYVLFDPAGSSLKTKQQVAYVVGHELAHQWFGNLVTMEWWSDLWLNEGFATWVGWLAADHLFPEWDIWTEFLLDDCQAGLNLDGLRSSHPIEVPVKSPAEISQIFDSISYSKGASLIRMLVTWLGEEVFRAGIRRYLRRYQYGNARTDQLWEELAAESGQDVSRMMSGWTRTVGYPLVSLDLPDANTARLRQRRFLAAGDVKPADDATIWSVPVLPMLSAAASDDQWPASLLLDRKELSLPLGGHGQSRLVKLNSGQTGFYRVRYPTAMLESLGAMVEQGGDRLSTSDRIGVLSDSHALSVAGDLDLTAYLELAVRFRNESDYMVWTELLAGIGSVVGLFWQDRQASDRLDGLVQDLTRSKAAELGFAAAAGESDKTALLRALVVSWAGRSGNRQVIEEARRRFDAFAFSKDEAALSPNLRNAVYQIAVREGGRREWERLLELYGELRVPDQRLAALGALGAARDPGLLQRALELTKDAGQVKPQDVIYIFRAVGGNRHGRDLCWRFVQENWGFFHERYQKGGFSLLSRIVTSCTDGFTTTADADSVEGFFGGRPEAERKNISRALEQSLERIRTHSAWLVRNREQVGRWLAERLPKLLAH